MPSLEATRLWKRRKRAEGWCGNCFKVKAGGEGGTKTRCPKCAEAYRKWFKTYSPKAEREHQMTVEALMRLSGKLKTMRPTL